MQSFLHLHKIRRMVLVAFPLALGLLFLFPTVSQAHAILLRSDPSRDAVLTSAPDQVRMWFSEDLNPGISTTTVVNASNRRVDANNAHVSSSDTREMDVSLQPDLSPGVYIVLYTTQSADDGHILRGSFIFNIAGPDGTVPKSNGVLPGQNDQGGNSNSGQLDGPTFFSFIMVTLVDLGAIFWVGAQLWRTFVLQLTDTGSRKQEAIEQRTEERFDRDFSMPILFLLLLANIGVLLGQALALTGGNLGQAFNPTVLGGLASNGRFGTYWLMREIVIFLAIVLAAITLVIKKLPQSFTSLVPWINLVFGLALLIALTMSGHAAATNSNILVYAVLVDWLHLLAASLWVGGMIYTSVIYLPAMKENTLLERARSLISLLPHFSPLAITGVVIMAVTGPFNAVVHLTSLDQLITTAYGRALVVKVVLVGALLLTSTIHVGLLRPRLKKDYKSYLLAIGIEEHDAITVPETGEQSTPAQTLELVKPLEISIGRQTSRLTSVLRWEPLLGVAVLVCTGLMNVLAGTLQPAAASQPAQQPVPTQQIKPFVATVKTSDNMFTAKLTVSPNRFGPNVFTVTVLDSKGAVDTNVGVSVYTTMLDMDMGTDAVNLQPDGKGNFSANGDLSMSGNWSLRIQIRAPDNKLHEGTVKMVTPA